ncbi:hypothetical protein GCM10027562_19550 [Arthrobacter pigmenti]
MGRRTRGILWMAWVLLMCGVMYLALGWLGVLLTIAAGAVGALATFFVNRKVRRDEQIARFRNEI